jgi:hypothetical protein
MTMRSTRALSAVLLAVGFHLSVSGGSLHKVWELNLKEVMQSSGGSVRGRQGVTALRFSPDGSKIALGAEGYYSAANAPIRLMVIEVEHPSNRIQQLKIDGAASDSDLLGDKPPAIAWVRSLSLQSAARNWGSICVERVWASLSFTDLGLRSYKDRVLL